MNRLDYLIDYLLKEDPQYSEMEIPADLQSKRDLFRADVLPGGGDCVFIRYGAHSGGYEQRNRSGRRVQSDGRRFPHGASGDYESALG